MIPDLPDNTSVPEETDSVADKNVQAPSAAPKQSPDTSKSAGAASKPLAAFSDIMEEIKEKNKILGSLLTEAKAYSVGTDTVVISVPVFASTMLKNDVKKVDTVENVVKKYVGDVKVKFDILGSKKEEEWEL